jgi:hypothetical protein
MTTNEINQALHEALGKCWHESELYAIVKNTDGLVGTTTDNESNEVRFNPSLRCKKCHVSDCSNPDYCGDPRLVIEAMQERDDWFDFVQYICPIDNKPAWSAILDLLDLIMDKSGKLAMLAIEWMKEAKDE